MKNTSMSVSQAYSLLGVESGADMDTVKKAYKDLALRTHPDKVCLSQEGLFMAIYAFLSRFF